MQARTATPKHFLDISLVFPHLSFHTREEPACACSTFLTTAQTVPSHHV